jgi:hypothetical protein
MASVSTPFNPQMARLARAALIHHTLCEPFDRGPARSEFADLPETDVRTALKLMIARQ